ncbi:MAG: hypothetical protein HY697_03705 [Deltaproteobacteria bacterium]|nr:hypothetical protein [Deltaproteobacteria bacterium]
MSKQERRIRKDLDRLWRAGSYGEWLVLVERENLQKAYPREWAEAWSGLVKRAPRLRANLQDFWSQIEGIRHRPDSPDLKCLLLLKEFVSGGEVREKLAAPMNLAFPVEALRKKALSWEENLFPEGRIREILQGLVERPGEITPQDYQELSSLARATPFSPTLAGLGASLEQLNQVNPRTPKRKGRPRLRLDLLAAVDVPLRRLWEDLPASLRQVFFYPFLFRIAQLFRRWAEKNPAILEKAASGLPFLLPLLAGEKIGAIHLRLARSESTSPSALDSCFLNRVINSGSLEEKIALVRKMRAGPGERDEADSIPELHPLYFSLLADLSREKQALSDREQRELTRVTSALLERDLPLLWQGPEPLLELMDKIARVGFLEGRLALLTLVLAQSARDKELKEQAWGALQGRVAPSSEDIQWLLREFSGVIFPMISGFRPLLDLWGKEAPFIPALAAGIEAEIKNGLVKNSISKNGRGILEFLLEAMDGDMKPALGILRRELQSFKDCPAFLKLIDLLDSFPEGVITAAGEKNFWQKIYTRTHNLDGAIDFLQTFRDRKSKSSKFSAPHLIQGPMEALLAEQEKGCLLFLQDQAEDLKRAGLEKLGKLATLLSGSRSREALDLLIRISNWLWERAKNGEEPAGNLQQKILNSLWEGRQGRQKRIGRKRP